MLLSMRMQKILKQIIHHNQVGYNEERSVNDHIRLIDDILNSANEDNLEGILVSLDYRKAFDTVSKSAILCALKKFNFGPTFIKFVKTILSGTEASVKNAGALSQYFNTNRGIRQGCCLSPLLFIMVVELLAIKIRNNSNIKGIFDTRDTSNSKTKLLSYADDMLLFLSR